MTYDELLDRIETTEAIKDAARAMNVWSGEAKDEMREAVAEHKAGVPITNSDTLFAVELLAAGPDDDYNGHPAYAVIGFVDDDDEVLPHVYATTVDEAFEFFGRMLDFMSSVR